MVDHWQKLLVRVCGLSESEAPDIAGHDVNVELPLRRLPQSICEPGFESETLASRGACPLPLAVATSS